MIIIDNSPNHENKTGKPGKIAIFANRRQQYKTAIAYFVKYYNAAFPNGGNIDFEAARALLPKNSKIIISCCWNSIIGRYELTITNKTIIKNNSYFWRYDFIGNLTDFAA